MPKTFRKFRASNARNYVFYAFGEIFLVVIGILIALQINNANEAKKISLIEEKLLSDLKLSLENELLGVERNINSNREVIGAIENITDFLNQKQTSGLDTMTSNFARAFNNYYLTFQTSAFENIKSYGISVIKDTELLNQLNLIYEIQVPYLIKEQKDQNDSRNLNITPHIARQFKIIRDKRGRIIYEPLNIQNLKSDIYYQNLLTLRLSEKSNELYWLNWLKTTTESVISELESR